MKAITGQVLPSLPVRIVRNIRYTSTHLAPFINQGPPPQACNTTQVPKTNSPTSSVVLVQLCDERTTCRSWILAEVGYLQFLILIHFTGYLDIEVVRAFR
jgi:hypothetical protein